MSARFATQTRRDDGGREIGDQAPMDGRPSSPDTARPEGQRETVPAGRATDWRAA